LSCSLSAGRDRYGGQARKAAPADDSRLKSTRLVVTWALDFRNRTQEHFMSQHRSLKGASTITAKRNVLKRFERVELLKKRGQFKEGTKVIGLPKTKPDA
jgi:small basic protein (TIGR04137 family)